MSVKCLPESLQQLPIVNVDMDTFITNPATETGCSRCTGNVVGLQDGQQATEMEAQPGDWGTWLQPSTWSEPHLNPVSSLGHTPQYRGHGDKLKQAQQETPRWLELDDWFSVKLRDYDTSSLGQGQFQGPSKSSPPPPMRQSARLWRWALTCGVQQKAGTRAAEVETGELQTE